MKKDKSNQLKKKDKLLAVADESKDIIKNDKNQKKKIKKAAQPKGLQEAVAEAAAPAANGLKKKKQKKTKSVSEGSTTEVKQDQKELAETDLAKIERKKAKKLAQKLKKKEKKALAVAAVKPEVKKESKQATKVTNTAKSAEKTAKPANGKLEAKKKTKLAKKEKAANTEKKEKIPRDPNAEVATVFVGNLPVNTKRVQIVRLFKDYAPVNAVRLRTAGGKPIYKHKIRKEAGSLNAYVVLKDAATAERALALNGSEFKDNHLRVTRSDMNSHNRGNEETKRTVFVGNLKYTANEAKLREIFSSCGDIEYIRCLHDGEKGCKGVAYVCFKAPEAVGLALELKETMLDERPIHVERYSVKKLGAKQARDAETEAANKNKKVKTGAQKRLDNKKKPKEGKDGGKQGGAPATGQGSDKDQKKAKFHGVKVGGIKKKEKKKKPTNQMQNLAKKIAPKARA